MTVSSRPHPTRTAQQLAMLDDDGNPHRPGEPVATDPTLRRAWQRWLADPAVRLGLAFALGGLLGWRRSPRRR